jgi:hypothetical protein
MQSLLKVAINEIAMENEKLAQIMQKNLSSFMTDSLHIVWAWDMTKEEKDYALQYCDLIKQKITRNIGKGFKLQDLKCSAHAA